jgi:hypothetical protein
LQPLGHAGLAWLVFTAATTGEAETDVLAGSLPGAGTPPIARAVAPTTTTFVTINMIVSGSWSPIQDRPAEGKNRRDLP